MQGINVEQIMKEIRDEVSEKGYKKSDLRFAGNPLPTVRAVFDAVRGGRKERAAHGTFLSVLGLIEFRIEQLIKRKYGNPKPLTEQGIGNELRAYASVPVVQ